MDQYSNFFNGVAIDKYFFFRVISVSEYGDLMEMKENDPEKYSIWSKMAEKKYGENSEEVYLKKSCLYPEYSKIVGIAYGNAKYDEQSALIRNFEIIIDIEKDIIERFFKVLEAAYDHDKNIMLCGHNITGYDIQSLIKRAIKHEIKIPTLFQNSLIAKPWESKIMDTLNLWKFGGSGFVSLAEIGHFLELKYNDLPLDLDEINELYWLNRSDNSHSFDDFKKWCSYEARNSMNMALQLIVRLRNI